MCVGQSSICILYLVPCNALHCQKPLLWSGKKFPCMAVLFCVIRHVVPPQIWRDGVECLATWERRRVRGWGSKQGRRELRRKGILLWGEARNVNFHRNKNARGGEMWGKREREFNRRFKKVMKKGRGQVRRRDVNGVRWKKGVRE